jgi:sugar phosphate isomerase/epimerase
MFVERPAGFLELRERLGSTAEALGLTLDVGHLLCTGDTPVPEAIAALGPYLVNVHLDDIRAGVHEHLMFGQGDLDLEGTLSALLEVGYDGVASVELSRDSHRGASAAQEAIVRVSKALVKGA